MDDEYASLSAGIEGWPSKEEMCRILESENLSLNVGKYSIRIIEFDSFVFREYGGDLGDPCITAEAESTEELIRQSKIVSQALSKEDIRHRFEIYGTDEGLVLYLHHKWPKDW